MSMKFPAPAAASQPFWDGLRAGKLRLPYDPVARRHQFPPRAISVRTGKRNLVWRTVKGRGVVHAVTEAHVAAPGFDLPVPYKVALVELECGVRLMGRLAPDDVDGGGGPVAIGTAVEIAFEALGADTPFFVFRRRRGRA